MNNARGVFFEKEEFAELAAEDSDELVDEGAFVVGVHESLADELVHEQVELFGEFLGDWEDVLHFVMNVQEDLRFVCGFVKENVDCFSEEI